MSRQLAIPIPTEELKLKEVPMFTEDEVEIKLNSILYRISWESEYGFKGVAAANIEALRVFYVNNTARNFRVRCPRGCEEIFKVADGCARHRLYGTLTAAKNAIREHALVDLKKCTKKMHDAELTHKVISNELKRIERLKQSEIKMPRRSVETN